MSQYNNFMRSVAQQPKPILQTNNGHSRNHQNLAPSSKTHNESMIYNNGGSIGGSFNNGPRVNGSSHASRPMTSY